MPFKLIVQNSKIVLKTVANYILNVSGIKDLYTASSDVDSNGKIDWSLQHYSGTAASFTSNNPILLVGQLGIETDDLSTTPKFKIGDGVTAWNSLPYAISGGGGSQSLQDVVTVSPTVDGVLAESLDTTQKYEITNDGLKLNGAPSTTAKTITLNKDGVLNSSTGSGIEFEEDGGIVGYIKTAVGAAFDFLHALNPFRARIALNLLTANRTYNLPDNSGTIALTSDIPSTTNLVPYTGATGDVDLGNNGLNAKTLNIKGTGGTGHLGLKHQSSSITANTSESSLGADSSGNPVWKNDGNAIQNILTDSNITQTITNGVTDKAPSEDAVYDALVLKQSTIKYYNPLDYGAVMDGVTDDSTAIQNTFNASYAATGHYNIIFPVGVFKINTEIIVDVITANVNIIGNNTELKSGVTTGGKNMIWIKQAETVNIEGIKFNFNNTALTYYGIRLGDGTTSTVGVLRIVNCDFFNFGDPTTNGINIKNTPKVNAETSNGGYNKPSAIIQGCNFYNVNTLSPTLNYSSTTIYYGVGIYAGNLSDYMRISDCSFNYIRIGVWSVNGANMDITGCNFLALYPKVGSSYLYGAIYVPNTGFGANNGKINVVACKFNHNFGYSIYYAYAGTERPLTVTGCHFIANCATAIYITHTSVVTAHHQIKANHFERTSQAYTNSMPSQPFGAALLPFIYLNNQTYCTVKLNDFMNDASYALVTAGSSDYNVFQYNEIKNITGATSLVGSNNKTIVGDLLSTNNLSDVSNTNTALNTILPTQTSNSNKVLQTNGTNTSWATVLLPSNDLSDVSNTTTARNNILPSKTGNNGKFLRVNAGETDYELATISGGSADEELFYISAFKSLYNY